MKTTIKRLLKRNSTAICAMAATLITLSVPAVRAAEQNEDEKRAEAIDGDIRLKSQNAVHFIPFNGTTSAVTSVKSRIKIDGDLADWRSNGVKPIKIGGPGYVTWNGEYKSEANLSAQMYLGADDESFYIGLEVKDDKAPAPNRIEVAFADAERKVIVGWVDVGKAYGADDVHLVFNVAEDGKIGTRFLHRQERLDESMINNAFGTEDERRRFVENGPADAQTGKIFSAAKREKSGEGSVTYFEAAFPWRMLTPYVPTTYSPLKFNLIIHDNDGEAGGGAIGWAPGLYGAYSGYHFPVLTFSPRADRKDIAAYAMLPSFEFVNENINPTFTFHNNSNAEVKGVLELFDAAAPEIALSTNEVVLPPGKTGSNIAVHSEKLGKRSVALAGRLLVDGREPKTVQVSAPAYGDLLKIQPVAELEALISRLVDQTLALSNLCEQVKAKGLDTRYPEAMVALHELFIGRCRGDLRSFPRLVIANTEYLNELFPKHKEYMETILKDPSKQLRMPAQFKANELTFKDGFYSHKGKPVWLWGPCTFWFMRNDLPYAWRLGANSISPEIDYKRNASAATNYLNDCYTNGMLVNIAIDDSSMEELKKVYPEIANVDPNNFLAFLIQHPIARAEIVNRIKQRIEFFKSFPVVRSFWLWNEPDYRNFSEMTRRDFIDQYAKKKYVSIEELNKRWGSKFKSFEDIQLPRGLDRETGNHAPWVDFQMFMQDLHADFFNFLNKAAKTFDPKRPTHTKFMSITAASFDIERLQSFYDISGHDGNCGERDLVFLDLCRSVYPDKPLVNTEIHIWYRDWASVAVVPWKLAIHGLADGNWWCWHPNHRFSNTTGSAQSMHALSFSGMDVQRLFDPYIFALNQKERKIATIYPDIVADRSWGIVDKFRYQIAPPQYELGVQPHYATEKAVARRELSKFKLVIACETTYVSDSTYQGVLDYVNNGGTAIMLTNSFARTKYNDPRDTSELMSAWGWEEYAVSGAVSKAVGKGRVIAIMPPLNDKGEIDGGALRNLYTRVFDQAMTDLDLHDPVRLVHKDIVAPTPLKGVDVRCAKVGNGYVLAAIGETYGDGNIITPVRLETQGKIKRITDLINNAEVPVDDFKLLPVANLFLIEIE